MSIIHITDHQSDRILDDVTAKNILLDNHHRSLKDNLETFNFTTFANKPFSQYLSKRNRLIIPDEDGEYIEFIISESIKYRDSQGLQMEVYSHASYLDLKKAKVIYPTILTEYTPSTAVSFTIGGTEWQAGVIQGTGYRTFHIENHTNPFAFLKVIANEFGLELRFRTETDGNKVTGRYVDLLEKVGEWRGREIEFGRDLIGIRRIEKQDIYTALVGIGPIQEDGTRIEVLVEDDEALQRWGRPHPITGELQHLIGTYEPIIYDENMNEERLRQLTRTELDKRINGSVEYETDIADLENVPGMDNKKIRFGDTIKVKDTKFNPPLYLEARVHTQDRSIVDKSKKRVTLGDYIEYTEEEVKAVWKSMQEEIRRRLARMVQVTIESSAGDVFKNGEGSTDLTAIVFLTGNEVDQDGEYYNYYWRKFDKRGIPVSGWSKSGKTISVSADEIDEKATFSIEINKENTLSIGRITISNVFDGEDGEPGPPGPKGDKGDKGDPGPQGPPGTSVVSIVECYLASDQSSGVTTSTPGWTTTMQQMTPQKRYLWNYERINFSDGTHQNTNPVIIGVYGDEGEEGRSIVGITEYYLATNASSGVTRNTSGWTTTMQVTTPEKKYLWNYEEITWNKAPTKTYTEPVIIGVHGEQGPKGEDGKTFYTWIKYADTPTSGMSDSPEGKEYIGIAYNKETPTPSTNYADYVWSKFKGEQGIPGPPGEDGQPTYTWVKYADDEHGNGMSDSPEGKLYIGLAFNKTTPTESNNPADYTWSLMPQNIEIGVRNLIRNSDFSNGTIGYVLYSPTSFDGTVSFEDGVIKITSASTTLGGFYIHQNYRPQTLKGQVYTVTIWAKGFGTMRIGQEGVSGGFATVTINSDDYMQYSHTFTPNITSTNAFSFYVNSPTDGIYVDRVKLEKGNKATGWTRAEEDVDQAIEETKTYATEVSEAAYLDAINDAEAYLEANGIMQGKDYNGVSITNQEGFVTARGDGLVRTVQNSTTGYLIQRRASKSSPWEDVIYFDTNGNAKFIGEIEALSGRFGNNLYLKDGNLQITRPDGAIWMQDGMVQQDYNVTSVDPYDMDYVNLSGNLIDGVFRASRGFYRAGYEAIVGGGDYLDIRDPDKGWSVKFTTYEFVHSARYLVIGYRKGINVTNPRHNTQVWEGDNRLYIEWHEPGGRPNQAPIIIDLGTPTYEVRNFQLRIGVNRSDVSGNDTVIFRIDRVFLTDGGSRLI